MGTMQLRDAAAAGESRQLLETVIYPASAWPGVAAVWSELAAVCPQASVFTSRPWTETWIEVFASRLDVSIAIFQAGEQPVGACLLVRSRRYGILLWERISLNASGEHAAESTYIEYNTLLCRPGWEQPVADALAEHLRGQSWDEIALDGFTPGPQYEALKRAFAHAEVVERWQPSYYIDLAALRRSADPWQRALGRATRSRLRQNRRYYSELGPVVLEHAEDEAAALAMFEQLAEFNRRRWSARTAYAVFNSPSFLAFHRSLIQRCFGQGSVQLLRCRAGAHLVGLLYNLVDGGRIYNYQCGYNYTANRRLSPGLLTLCEAIQWSLAHGFDDFDHLAGEVGKKRSLSTGSRRLVWASFRRRGWKTRLLDWSRQGRRWFSARSARAGARDRKDSGSSDEQSN